MKKYKMKIAHNFKLAKSRFFFFFFFLPCFFNA